MLDKIVESLNRQAPGAVLEASPVPGDDRLRIERRLIRKVAEILKTSPDLDFAMLVDLTAVDWLGQPERFEIVYQLNSLSRNIRLRLKVRVPEGEELESVTGVWAGAEPLEREIYDMFGVRFTGHPKLKRLLMWEGFEGHPLRKDYPLKKHQPLVPLLTPIRTKDDPPYNWTRFEHKRRLEEDD